MLKRCLSLIVVVIMVVIFASNNVEAMLVYDRANHVENLANKLKMILMYEKQLEQFEQGRLNLVKSTFHIFNLGGSLKKLNKVSNTDLGEKLDYVILKEKWNEYYTIDPVKATGKTSGKYFADKAKELTQHTNDATYNAKIAQGMITEIDSEIIDLQEIIKESQGANGALQAAQLANQIAALQTAQMMRAQCITASSQHAQSAYQAQAIVREAMVTQATERYYATDKMNYIKGQGPGIIGINK